MSLLEMQIERHSNPVDMIEFVADSNDWTFERSGEDEIAMTVAGHWADYHISFSWMEEFEALRQEFFANYESVMTAGTYVFDGVDDLIEHIQLRQMPWGVVTNKMARFTDPLTAAMPLFASARAIVSGDTTPHPKPHPEPLFEAARRLGLPPEVCLYVGDDERDIAAGRAAGMPTVAATYGYLGEKTDVSTWGADLSIDSPNKLLQLLAEA